MDDYHLLQQIGEGSFGRVYKARRKYTGRICAIKMIKKLGQSKDDLLSFKREIEILQKVKHPNIMRMLNIFETDTDFCVVSELARGDLFQIIDDNQTLPEDVLRNVAAQLVSALAYLHKNRIIHRDMKPQNILITGKGALKLCDFGFARALSHTTLFLNSIKGTPLYMAPELVQEQQYDEKIDVWSLGIILYELYYGQPPFFTNSIYKLIQMIVNDNIKWPGTISVEFKNFLLRMLQKNPDERVSCEDLMSDPFIKNVNLKDFDDHVYKFKTKQFEEAIKESLSPGAAIPFKPPKSRTPDFQSIFVNPSVRSAEELLLAVKYLRELKVNGDSPLAASFSFHFNEFISKPEVLEEALLCAAELLRTDQEKFLTQFTVGISVLQLNNMPLSAIEFLTRLLSIPYGQSVVSFTEASYGDLQLNTEKSEVLRDRLFSFLFASEQDAVEKTYVFLAFLTQVSDVFLATLCGNFAPKFMPIVASSVIHHPSNVVRGAALCILARIVDKDNSAIKSIQPIDQFCEKLVKILNNELKDLQTLCIFSSAISFIAVSLKLLTEIPEFQKIYGVRSSLSNISDFVSQVFAGEEGIEFRLNSFLRLAAEPPQTESDLYCYVSVLSSPFSHFPINGELLPLCVGGITNLLPYHQPALLATMFTLDPDAVTPFIPSLLQLFNSPNNASIISEYITQILGINEKTKQELINSLCKASYLDIVAGCISELGPQIPPAVVYAWSQVILSFKEPTRILVEAAPTMLAAVFALDSAVETSLMIGAHLSRLSQAFIPKLLDAGAITLAERALQSEAVQIRTSALSFIGNFCRRDAIPSDSADRICSLIVNQLSDQSQVCVRQASFALGNVLLKNPSVASIAITEIRTILSLLTSTDNRTVENAAGVLGNLVRKNDDYLKELIDKGALDLMVRALGNGQETGGRVILQIAVFCQHKPARLYLQNMQAEKAIALFRNSSDERVRKYANSIIESFGA